VAESPCGSIVTWIEAHVDDQAARIGTRQIDVHFLTRQVAIEERAGDQPDPAATVISASNGRRRTQLRYCAEMIRTTWAGGLRGSERRTKGASETDLILRKQPLKLSRPILIAIK
jgi:hypothetical protein